MVEIIAIITIIPKPVHIIALIAIIPKIKLIKNFVIVPIFTPSPCGDEHELINTRRFYMKRVKKTSYKAQKKYFAKTAALNGVQAMNSRPTPQRGGFRL